MPTRRIASLSPSLSLGAALTLASCTAVDDREKDEDGSPGLNDEGELGGELSEGDDGDDLDVRWDLGDAADWEGEQDGGEVGGEGGGGDGVCDMDFLFVIDNSGSMADEQQNLSNSVPKFIETIQEKLPKLDSYHIGVVATAPYNPTAAACQGLGGMITATAGENSSDRQCGPYASEGNYMDQDDNLDETFTCAARPGTDQFTSQNPGNERPIRAMLDALAGAPADNCNAGFLRPEALLVVILITDEEDDDEDEFGRPRSPGSGGNPPDWYADLLAVKGGDERRIVVLSLLGTPEDNACSRLFEPAEDFGIGDDGAVISRRLIEFTEMFGKRGFVGDVCAPDYGPFFDDAVGVVEVACKDIPPAR